MKVCFLKSASYIKNNMIKKISATIVFLIAVVSIINSQNKSSGPKLVPSVAIGVGVLSFDGDIASGLNLTSLNKVRGGYTLSVEQRFGKFIGVSVNGIYGKLADGERGATRNLNFESQMLQADLNCVLHFDNDLILKRQSSFAPYVSGGFGFLKFNSFGDLKNKDGIPYNYWEDGSIRSDSMKGSTVIRRDYTYETKLNDSKKYSNSSFAIPVALGVDVKIIDKFYINLAATYYFTTTDWIDNFKDGKNDRYVFVNMAFKYIFGNSNSLFSDDSNPVYNTVDFVTLDSLDSDGDKVLDAVDFCPGTPIDVAVTPDGCPEDSDADGVPDYMDKEVLTIVGRYVNESGETITEKMFEAQHRRFNSLATERSQLFNENPSFKYLKQLEAKSRSVRKNNPKSAIPVAMLPYDLDDDDYISAEELVKAIDAFFDGESEVENLNNVIDFFFEQ